MQTSKWIRVRPLRVNDFRFVRRLASQRRNFTVPPLYVLWLLKRTNARSCFVARHVKLGPVAYLLSILVPERHGKTLYIWQLATAKRGVQAGATEAVLVTLRRFVRRARVSRMFFTVDPKSPEFRTIRRHVYSLFGKKVGICQFLPDSVSRRECEYVVKLG
jgi:hypothetical protein